MKFSVSLSVVVHCSNSQEAFRLVREQYAIVHDPHNTIKSESFIIDSVDQMHDDEDIIC